MISAERRRQRPSGHRQLRVPAGVPGGRRPPRWPNSTASAAIRPSLANSAGWISKPPPITIQACAPLMVEPIANTASSPRMLAR